MICYITYAVYLRNIVGIAKTKATDLFSTRNCTNNRTGKNLSQRGIFSNEMKFYVI